jgi:hypothetical protein
MAGVKPKLETERHEKQKKELEGHKASVKSMKKNISSVKSRFSKGNLNPSFFANAKKSNADEVKGWAFDFDNDTSL